MKNNIFQKNFNSLFSILIELYQKIVLLYIFDRINSKSIFCIRIVFNTLKTYTIRIAKKIYFKNSHLNRI